MPYFKSDLANFHYYEYGTGSEIMLAFHGFGMHGRQFRVLEEALGKKYKIYSFDLFFHGETKIFDESRAHLKNPIGHAAFAAQMQQFLKSIGAENQQFALLSYSIGTRMALSLIKEMPNRVLECFFIAPDGIEPNTLVNVIAKNRVINYIFWRLVYNPRVVMFMLNSLLRFRYIDDSLHYILAKEFETVDTRLVGYNTITYLAELQLNKQDLAEKLNQNNINSYFYFGKKDELFPPSLGKRITKDIKNTQLHIVDDDHDLVNHHLNDLIKEDLLANN
ncbi:alpha/beta hydrolase [Pelobium sp.]|nr:alpha/beta hydrolase [Pelobium sp.]MDA9555097.1 alpha/beta hydrolase [Pelobium sp.]